jgi:hypothetical protein
MMNDLKSAVLRPTRGCISDPPSIRQLTLNQEFTFQSQEGKAIDLVSVERETLEALTPNGQLTTLEAENVSSLDQLLAQDFPNLNRLDVLTPGGFPSVGSLVATGQPLYPDLTNFHFQVFGSEVARDLEENLLEFLRHCPLLEVAFFCYDEPKTAVRSTVGEAVSLPYLKSFTHKSPSRAVSRGLINRLSLPDTCNIEFKGCENIDESSDHPHST